MSGVGHLTNISHKAVHAFFFFQVEDTLQEGQEKEEEEDKGKIKAEDNAIEMSEDFDGKMQDGDENEAGMGPTRFWGLFHKQDCENLK